MGGYCAGLNCYSAIYSGDSRYEEISTDLEFLVQKCEDPVTVYINVVVLNGERANNYYFGHLYNQSETVDSYPGSYTGILERNATHVGFMVSVYRVSIEDLVKSMLPPRTTMGSNFSGTL